MKLKLFIISIFALLAFVALKQYRDFSALKSVNSYDSCVTAKGSVIQESYPATCITKYRSKFIQSTPQPSSVPTINTATWKVYTNKKYNFQLRYPPELNLVPKEVNIYQNYQDYHQKCVNGTYQGCGGSRWPDYKITFFRTNGKGAFDVDIWKGEEISQYIKSISHNGYAYNVSTFRSFGEYGEIDPVSEEVIDQILSTFKFTDTKSTP